MKKISKSKVSLRIECNSGEYITKRYDVVASRQGARLSSIIICNVPIFSIQSQQSLYISCARARALHVCVGGYGCVCVVLLSTTCMYWAE